MDAGGTHARDEDQQLEKALESSRLRSSARLGFAPAPPTSSPISSGASCRLPRRKKKTRRRRQRQQSQRHPQSSTTAAADEEDNEEPVTVPVSVPVTVLPSVRATLAVPPTTSPTLSLASDSADQPTSNDNNSLHPPGDNSRTDTTAAEITPGSGSTINTGDIVPTAASGSGGGGGGGGGRSTSTNTDPQEESERPLKYRVVIGEASEIEHNGGSSTRVAASAVGSTSASTTLLNTRRATKRPSRRCNAAARRNAMTMDLQRLIAEVHARPAIWDQKNVNYHNRDVILKMWREIARACEVSTDVAKSKWKHLRDNFRNELKKTYRGKSEAGIGIGSTEHDSKWVWFKSLFFLRDQMNSRVIGCTLSQNCTAALRSSPEETQIEPQIDILEGQLQYEGEPHYEDLDGDSCQSLLSNDDGLHHVMPPPKLNKIGRKRTLMDAMMNDYSEERKRYECLQKRLTLAPDQDEDDTYHFLMSVRNPLRSLPLDRQMFVRLKIQELVYNEINCQNQASRTCDGIQDIKPPRSGNGTIVQQYPPTRGIDHSCVNSTGTATASGHQAASAHSALPEVGDMSNQGSLIQNCTSDASSDGVSYD